MDLKPFKFAIQAVITEHDETGAIIGERAHETVIVYGVAKLAEYARDFEAALERALKEPEELTTAGEKA